MEKCFCIACMNEKPNMIHFIRFLREGKYKEKLFNTMLIEQGESDRTWQFVTWQLQLANDELSV